MLRAGFARIDITPGPECSLIGYGFRPEELPPGNVGVHDPLYARVLVLQDGERPAALIALDLCILETKLARHLREAVAAKLRTTAERVILACSHTHSGPFPQLPDPEKAPEIEALATRVTHDVNPNHTYAVFLREKLEEAVAAAGGLTYPVCARVQEAPVGLAYNRRVQTPAGVKLCWNPQEFPHLSPRPAPDPTCTVLVLRQANGSRKHVLWSIGAHGVGLGKTSRVVSADWPGLTCTLLDGELPGCQAMFFAGAAGNAHPWIATQDDPEQLWPVARAAAGMVGLLTHGANAYVQGEEETLRTAARTITVNGHELDLSVWRLGPAWVVAAPVELFGELANELRRRLAGPVLLSTVSNGWTGYWPTAAAFDEGGYEINASWVCRKGDGEDLIDALTALAETLKTPEAAAV